MPLTLDSMTLTWLSTRISLWLVMSRGLLGLLLLGFFSGCVPAMRFEETQSAAQVEMEGRRRAEHEVQQLKAKNQELLGRMREQGSLIDERDEALAQAALDTSGQGKQREGAEGLVEQLRGELSRVGEHLRVFHDDKQKLELERSAEVDRGQVRSRAVRDLALLLAEPVAAGIYSLDAEQRTLVLRAPRERLLAEDGSVKADAQPLVKALARVLHLHAGLRLGLRDSRAGADPLAVAGLVAALTGGGVASDRLETMVATPEVEGSPAQSEAPSLSGTPAASEEIQFTLSVT